jgi:hypothetical protein
MSLTASVASWAIAAAALQPHAPFPNQLLAWTVLVERKQAESPAAVSARALS